ncbi:MAG: hypothetical protein R3322_00160 [Kiloniellales bacterium]|nr:hypothetical protein [Kiloniellales bacterium]
MAKPIKSDEYELSTGVIITSGSIDPSSTGLDLPIGSLFLRDDGSLYSKTGAATTDWTQLS